MEVSSQGIKRPSDAGHHVNCGPIRGLDILISSVIHFDFLPLSKSHRSTETKKKITREKKNLYYRGTKTCCKSEIQVKMDEVISLEIIFCFKLAKT